MLRRAAGALMALPIMLGATKPWPASDPWSVYRNAFHPVPAHRMTVKGVEAPGYWLTRRALHAGPYTGPAVEAARAFLRQEGKTFGLTPDAVRNLSLTRVVHSDAGDHVRFRQTYKGIPVYGAEVVVTRRARDQRITFVSSRYVPNLELSRTTPDLSPTQAQQVALSRLPFRSVQSVTEPELVVYPQGKGRLAWRVVVNAMDPIGDWEMFVDAHTGEVFFLRDQAKYADGAGMVWVPDPLTTSHHYYNDTPEWADNNDADNDSLNGQRILVTLRGLTYNGTGYVLSGPFVDLQDLEGPTDVFPTPADSTAFQYTRFQQEFEDVMVYYHIDNIQRYFQDTLGVFFANNSAQAVDPHGLNGADNSHYVPSSDYIAWGEGGVDDDEDADVIIHEYGHAIQDDIVPGWGSSQEAAAMGEGFGDYLATTYSMAADTFRWADVFTWDGHNPFWPGRSCDMDTYHYPQDASREIHDAGQLWCSALLDVIWALDTTLGYPLDSARHVMDKLVLTHHTYLTASATMPEAAQAIIQADQDLYGGAHLSVIIPIFDARGFINASSYVPQITHTPLTDTEDAIGPYPVNAVVTPATAPIDSVFLFYWTSLNPAGTTRVVMTLSGGNTYTASIPGPGQPNVDISYYIYAVDTAGNFATHPAGAPSQHHTFHVGPDTIPPTIVHQPLRDSFPIVRWPAVVQATVTDNLGVDSVWVEWLYNGTPQTPFALVPQGGDVYSASFPMGTVNLGDQIQYRIWARDMAQTPNTAAWPDASTYHTVVIVQSRGTILVINDDTGDRKSDKGTVIRKFAAGETADSLVSWLNALGYTASLESADTTQPATWSQYDVLVWSSGEDITTVGQQTGNGGPPYADQRRQDLQTFIQNGGKVFFEGGELGWDAQTTSGDPTWAQQVLRINGWNSDNPGDLTLTSATHPIATTPNALPATIARNDITTTYGDGDALSPVTPAEVVFGSSAYTGSSLLLAGGRIVFASFNYLSLADPVVAKQLLENIMEYLVNLNVSVEEPTPPQALTRLRLHSVASLLTLQFAGLTPGTQISLTLMDASGRVRFQARKTLEQSRGTWRVRPGLQRGIYFYRVKAGRVEKKGKLIWLP